MEKNAAALLPLVFWAGVGRAGASVTVHVTPWGPDEAAIEAAKADMLGSALVQSYLRNTEFRILSFELIPRERQSGPPRPPEKYRAAIFDYTHNRTVAAEGSLDGGVTVASLSPEQPWPTLEEFDAAVEILRNDPHFGGPLLTGQVQAYRPMPPLAEAEGPLAESPERTVMVGLLSKARDTVENEIVGVNMVRRAVMRYPGGAPPKAIATPTQCGVPSGSGPGEAGDPSYHVTVNQGSIVIWDFIVYRGRYSSGGSGHSGVDLQNVSYRGKQVLAEAHVPILDVLYLNNVYRCGPYRDWLYDQWPFFAYGTDVGNGGFRICNTRPQTILDDGNDDGNFNGVAVYVKGDSVYLVGNHTAGWYRYVMEWRLDADGSIHPRFGFAATDSSCVCIIHTHHAFWRFDWNIEGASNDVIYEETRGGTTQLGTEVMKRRVSAGPASGTTWRVQNALTGDSYRIIRGPYDGTADAYGSGDLWMLQYHANEISDGAAPCLPPWCVDRTMPHLNYFLDGESIANQRDVIWYGVHFMHDIDDENSQYGHVLIGPDLVPVQW
jgi:hypothetical protein